MREQYEYLILGGGNGGGFLAWHMAHAGHRVAVVERRWIGGSCPNINCLPSKNEIWSAKVAHLLRHGELFGALAGSLSTNMQAVRKRKRDMVDGMIALARQAYKESGAELIMGTGRFIEPKALEVRLNDGGTRLLAGDRVFLNVGTRPAIPDVPGMREAEPLTNIEALELDYVPRHLIVLGAGHVGLELAQAFRRFGSPEAGEVMPVMQTAMLARLPYTTLRDAVIAHPTMAEGLGALLSSVPEARGTAAR